LIAYEELRQRVSSSSRNVFDIWHDYMEHLSPSTRDRFSWDVEGKALRNMRSRQYPSSSNARSMIDHLTKTQSVREEFGLFRGRNFFHAGLEVEGEFAAIFGIMELIDLIPNDCEIFIDCTFKIVPAGFKQLLVVLCTITGKFLL
jgi:hypothetical protein